LQIRRMFFAFAFLFTASVFGGQAIRICRMVETAETPAFPEG
jgi:hypothetical protein